MTIPGNPLNLVEETVWESQYVPEIKVTRMKSYGNTQFYKIIYNKKTLSTSYTGKKLVLNTFIKQRLKSKIKSLEKKIKHLKSFEAEAISLQATLDKFGK